MSFQSHELAAWCMATGNWELEMVKRDPGVRGWDKQPKRWIDGRTVARLLCSRRVVVDYERKVQTTDTVST